MRILAVAIVTFASACFFKPDPPAGSKPPGSGPTLAQFAVGAHHACQIDDLFQLWCWGDNRYGQLGVVTPDPYTGTPQQVPGKWRVVAAGRAHTCAIDDNGTVQCWGANNLRQIAGGPGPQSLGITAVDFSDPNKAPFNVFAGGDASCATMTDGELYCWGQYQPPQSNAFAVTRVDIGSGLASPPNGGGWEQVAMSDTHICVADNSDRVYCWGDNSRLQLGESSLQNRDVAHAFLYPDAMQHLSAGSLGTCGVGDDGAFVCWGHNLIVDADNPSAHAVMDPENRHDWKAVAVGDAHVCAARGPDGYVYCYGADPLSQLGDDFNGGAQLPESQVFSGATEVYASEEWTCARRADHTTYCWGSNQFGETGNGKVSTAHHPYKTLSGNIESIAAGPTHACAVLATTGQVQCWGTNQQHQITSEMGAEPFYTTPKDTQHTAVTVPSTSRLISNGAQFTCIRAASNQLECWGDNKPGPDGPFTPDAIGLTGSTWDDFGAGGQSVCATFTDTHQGWCWGALGDTGGAPKLLQNNAVVHVAVGNAVAVFAGDTGNNAIFVEPTPVDCFHSETPTPLGADGSVVREVVASTDGDGHACVETAETMTMNSLYCWGHNDHNQSASTVSQCADPTLVMFSGAQVKDTNGAARPVSISAGANHTCAIAETNQVLYCWGDNGTEALGETSFGVDTVPSPKIVTSDDTMQWQEVATAASYTCAITKAQDAVYCWGLNERGQVGNGDRFPSIPPTAPVQIPSM